MWPAASTAASTADGAMELSQRHIENTKLVPNRFVLLEHFPKRAVVAEIGVDEGRYAEKILAITEPRALHLIDTWAPAAGGDEKLRSVRVKFAPEIESGRVIVHRGRSVEVLGRFDDDTFDWVYLDTSHKYEDTLAELEVCRAKVKDDGLIAGHDYTAGNIESAIRYGVVEAVNEFCTKYDLALAYLSNEPRRYLSFAIKRK